MLRRKILLLGFALALGVASFSGILDRASGEVTGELLGKATVVYGTTRAVMAGLSFIEDVEFNVSVFVGTTISPFKVVKPINDFLERFSNILLLAITSLAVMKLMTFILGSTIVSWLYIGIAACFIVLVIRRNSTGPLREWPPFRWFVAATVIRFSFVLIIGMNFAAHELFLAERQQQAAAQLDHQAAVMESLTGEFANVAQPQAGRSLLPETRTPLDPEATEEETLERNTVEPPPFWWQRGDDASGAEADDGPGFFARMGSALSPRRLLGRLQAQAEAFIDTVIDLTVLFLMQAVLVPLLFGYLLLRALPRLFDW